MADADLKLTLELVGREKGIEPEVLIDALEQAILTAAKKTFGLYREMEAQFNPDSGAVDLFLIVNVVEDDPEEGCEITLEQAEQHGLPAQLGDELLFQVFYRAEDAAKAAEQDKKFGELIDLNKAHKRFGRIAAQTAKQVIYQRVREAERDKVFNTYKDRKGELLTGTVRRFERGAVIVDLSDAEAVLPTREQVSRESYRVGENIKAYVKEVDRNARGPLVVLSRTHRGLLEKLFEQEVPEIFEKIVRIESSAREPGARAKIAVSSRDRDVDPVGACVGMKGARVQSVVQELRGEKIDIVPYDDDPARFVCNAIAPAQVSRVIIDAQGHRMELIVPDDKLSLAIGKKGQNVRLASQLTGWRIDIHSESKIQELEQRAKQQMSAIESVNEDLASTLFRFGWRSVGELSRARPEELAQVDEIATEERAKAIIDAATVFRKEEEATRKAVKDEAKRRKSLTDGEKLAEVDGMDDAKLELLAQADVTTVEQLASLTNLAAAASSAELEPLELATLRFKAQQWLGIAKKDEEAPTAESVALELAPNEAETANDTEEAVNPA